AGIKVDPRIIGQDFTHAKSGVPAQGAPNRLVHIVMNAVGVGYEAVAIGSQPVVDRGELSGPGIDGLPAQSQRERLIPLRNLILADLVMGNVGIEAKLVLLGKAQACLRNGWTARPGN